MSKNLPDKHIIGTLKQLSTPWLIALERAHRVKKMNLDEGFILDLACGSGIQLAAYSSQLNMPCIGIELDPERAVVSKNTLDGILNQDINSKSRIITGNCLKKDEINLENNIHFSLIHLDPARPTDIQAHTISEMEPNPIDALEIWKNELMKNRGGIILDLSPRLSKDQCIELKDELKRILPDYKQTWEWASQGRGRVDRLSVWLGSVAGENTKSRYVRNHPKELQKSIVIESEQLPWENEILPLENTNVEVGETLSIVDPALISSGLENAWLNSKKSEGRWIRKSGRRPLFIHSKKLIDDGENYSLISESGIIRSIIEHNIDDGVEPLIEIGKKYELKKLTLRLKISPELQPNLQSKLDRNLIDFGGVGFVVELPNNKLAICTKI